MKRCSGLSTDRGDDKSLRKKGSVVNMASGHVGNSRVRDEFYFIVDSFVDPTKAISRARGITRSSE